MSKNIEELSYNELQKLANKLGAEKVIGVKGDDLKKFIKENQQEEDVEQQEVKQENTPTKEIDKSEDKNDNKDLKIDVSREGREDIFIPSRESLITWLRNKNFKEVPHMHSGNHVMIGTDWSLNETIEMIGKGDKIGLLVGMRATKNMSHSLSVIYMRELHMFDIGAITEEDLDIKE